MGVSSYHAFAKRRTEGADVLASLATAVRALPGTAELADQLDGVAERARQGRFVVHLVGCFSSGKSTLLNALLGEPVLPVKVNPCTAILTELVYADDPTVSVHTNDGEPPRSLAPAAFMREYQLQTTDIAAAGAEVRDRFGRVDRAVLGWPLPLLADGVVLLDTPGLDDDIARTERTLSALPGADAVIFVLNASRFLTDLERRTIRRDLLPLGLTNLFFPVTMVDLLDALSDDPERDLADMVERGREVLGPLCQIDGRDRFDERFFPLNARGALLARWDRATEQRRSQADEAALIASNVPAFESSLAHFLVHERGRAQLQHLVRQARRVHAEVGRLAELDRATANASVGELRRRAEELAPRFAELRAIASRVADTVDAFVARQQVLVWQDLYDYLADTEAKLPEALAHMDLGTVAGLDLLTPKGRERVEQRIRDRLESWLDVRLDQWQEALRPRIERSLDDLRNEIAADAADFDAVKRAIVTDFAGGAISLPSLDEGEADMDPVERWFSVAIGAVLLSPGAMAAGWSQGYEGALKGAASRIGVRVAVLALGALLGPLGWGAILIYVVSDAVLLVVTGGGQLRRLRRQVGESLEGRLLAQAESVRDDIHARVAEGLLPLRDGLVAAAEEEASELQTLLDRTIAARERAAADAQERDAAWSEALRTLEGGLGHLEALVEE